MSEKDPRDGRSRSRIVRAEKTDRLAASPFDRFAEEARPPLEMALAASLPARFDRAPDLSRAIEEAALSPGKRLRPLVALASGRLTRAPLAAATAVAVAVE